MEAKGFVAPVRGPAQTGVGLSGRSTFLSDRKGRVKVDFQGPQL